LKGRKRFSCEEKFWKWSELGFVEALKHLCFAHTNEATVFPANQDAEANEDQSEDKQDDSEWHCPQHIERKLRYKPAKGGMPEDNGGRPTVGGSKLVRTQTGESRQRMGNERRASGERGEPIPAPLCHLSGFSHGRIRGRTAVRRGMRPGGYFTIS
jgi:hypothetical protein